MGRKAEISACRKLLPPPPSPFPLHPRREFCGQRSQKCQTRTDEWEERTPTRPSTFFILTQTRPKKVGFFFSTEKRSPIKKGFFFSRRPKNSKSPNSLLPRPQHSYTHTHSINPSACKVFQTLPRKSKGKGGDFLLWQTRIN